MKALLPLAGLLAVSLPGPFRQDAAPAQDVRDHLSRVEARIPALRRSADKRIVDALPDATWFAKGVTWGIRYDTPSDQDLALMRRALARAEERLSALESGRMPWSEKRGRVARAYRSDVDGSIQPYGLVVPAGYDPAKPTRLDVVLHGSTRPVGMSELRYVMPFDEGDSGGTAPSDRAYIELYPLGRVENCYRWAGETDVFEAIEDVCRHYNIDRDRIVLRGMSMGASGTWHLGLKRPDRFVALGPYCGYVDTHRFSETPGMNFVKVGPLPDYQEAGLHMLDSVDYAANAGVVPVVAAIGEKDPFFQAHVIMGEAFKAEGLPFTNLISPGTAHVQDPKTWSEQMAHIGEYAARGTNHKPGHIRFVTWTLKYSRCHWVEVLGLQRHYERAEIDARLQEDGSVVMKEPRNVTRFALYEGTGDVTIGGQRLSLPASGDAARGMVFERARSGWKFAGYRDRMTLSGKRPGVQGPIDDAFTSRFLCVRGTGTPWNPVVDAWAEASLKRFAYEWARYLRGDLPVKNDTDVTPEDRRRCNLILFGDPGSNRLIREALKRMPVRWTKDELGVAKELFPSKDHAPAFIAPSPFARDRYVVVNSGHTFREAELNRLNYLLFPRWGDWAVLRVGAAQPVFTATPSADTREELVKAGYFDEGWK